MGGGIGFLFRHFSAQFCLGHQNNFLCAANMQNFCQTNMQCLYDGSGSEGTPIVAFLPFDIKGIKSCLWLYLASRGILGAQSNNYWQKTERVSLRRKEEEKYLQIVAEPAISVDRSESSTEW